jgi:hypothetical protein
MRKEKQNNIDELLLKLLVGKALPLSLVENKFFKDFVKELNAGFVLII